MDDQTLASLRAALDGSPENRDLRMVLVGAHLDRDEAAEAYALVRELERSDLAREDHRRLAARACQGVPSGTHATYARR